MPQFSEEEAQRIFARAAERQHATEDAKPGLSLTELQEIGRAAGLDPEHVAAAVAEMRTGPSHVAREETVLGIQTDIVRTRVIPGELTDELWESIVSQLRRTFKTKGISAEVGRSREWTGTNSEGGLSNLRLAAVPLAGGVQLTLETSKTEEVKQVKWLPLMLLTGTLLFPIIAMLKDKAFEPAILILSALFAVFAVVAHVGTRIGYRKWSERRQGEFDALLDQFDLQARSGDSDATPSSAMASHQPSPLGEALDELAKTPVASSTATSERLRS